MKILIPAVSGATRPDGVSRHAINLATCLLMEPDIERIDFVIGSWQSASMRVLIEAADSRLRIHIAHAQPSSWSRNLWYFDQLPRLAKRLRSDIVHATYPVPLQAARFRSGLIVTLHDLYPYDSPYNFGYPKVWLNRLILQQCLRASDAIACVSESTLNRLAAHDGRLVSKAHCIHNSIKPETAQDAVSCLTGHPFILSVAQHRRNKDIPGTLAVFRDVLNDRRDLMLALVGNEGPETGAIRMLLRDTLLRDRVCLLHGISEPELQWCYRNCALLLATSTHEGFGLPVAEAMLAGCPVVCSDIPAFRELGEGYCKLVPHTQSDLVAGVRRTLASPRPQAVELPQLSGSVIAAQYLRLYHGLLSRHSVNVSSRSFTMTGKAVPHENT